MMLFWFDFIKELLILSNKCLQAVVVRPLSTVGALVRFAEEPQMFAIEFNDGCPIHVRPCGFGRCQFCLFTCVSCILSLMSLFLLGIC